jgi:hypothetical protein
MTQNEIKKQIEIIKKASLDARKSKESSRQFLVDAGIIRNKKAPSKDSTKK